MGLFSRSKAKKELVKELEASIDANRRAVPPLNPAFRKQPRTKKLSFIEISRANRNGQSHLLIKAGNNKTRLASETYYTGRNATRAAEALSLDTGLKVVDRRAK